MTKAAQEPGAHETADCIIIGGGPGGLTSAIYLGRFLRKAIVIDAGGGRASSIPRSHNLPGFPAGISGAALLTRLKRQAKVYGATIKSGKVDQLARAEDGFTARAGKMTYGAPTVILATGVINHRPIMSAAVHDAALARGLIRYCPVCDAYGARVTLVAQRSAELPWADEARLVQLEIGIIKEAVHEIRVDGDQIIVLLRSGRELPFDTLYPALGSTPNTQLLAGFGPKVSDLGCVVTNAHQQSSIGGLFAVGDVVDGLDQISVATGHAANAATAIHNLLREREQG
jgi:thioredoxin reductase (NADPH)